MGKGVGAAGRDEESGTDWDAENVHLLTPTTFHRDHDQEGQDEFDADRYKSLPPLPRPSSNATSTSASSSRPGVGTRWI